MADLALLSLTFAFFAALWAVAISADRRRSPADSR
jgi:hypothetical protein